MGKEETRRGKERGREERERVTGPNTVPVLTQVTAEQLTAIINQLTYVAITFAGSRGREEDKGETAAIKLKRDASEPGKKGSQTTYRDRKACYKH